MLWLSVFLWRVFINANYVYIIFVAVVAIRLKLHVHDAMDECLHFASIYGHLTPHSKQHRSFFLRDFSFLVAIFFGSNFDHLSINAIDAFSYTCFCGIWCACTKVIVWKNHWLHQIMSFRSQVHWRLQLVASKNQWNGIIDEPIMFSPWDFSLLFYSLR